MGAVWLKAGQTAAEACSRGSIIDNAALEYFGTSYDYRIENASSGCGSCSGGAASSSSSELPSISVTRLLRPRYTDWQEGDLQGSFGYGSYWQEVDKSIRITTNGQIRLNDPKDHDQSVDALFDASRGAWVNVENAYFQTITLFDASGSIINNKADNINARTAIKLNNDGSTEHYEIYWFPANVTHGEIHSRAVGRLTAIMDRNGNAIQISYQHPIPADGIIAPANDPQLWQKYAELWKKSTVTDAYGRQISCHYIYQYGRYVVDKLTLPNNEEITYEYGKWTWWNGWLTAVNLPDGSRSTWTTAPYINAHSGLLKITQSDRSASAQEQRKEIYITHHWGDNAQGVWGRQAPHLCRRVDNGAGEMKYANNFAVAADGTPVMYIYRGGNSIVKGVFHPIGGPLNLEYVTDLTLKDNFYNSTYALTSSSVKKELNTFDPRAQVTAKSDAFGRNLAFTINPLTNAVLSSIRKDGTTAAGTYNPFNQPLTYTDRLGRQTIRTYSPTGNLLSTTRAAGTNAETTSTNIYNSRGQLIESRDALYDANTPELHNTRYEYNTAGYLTKKISSADVAGGTRPESTYTYDSAGRLATTTDPLGRTMSYEYDSRDRVIKITYNDTSTELTEYGTGDLANLVVSTTDRNGIKTTYQYDDAGRRIKTIVAEGLPEQSITEITYLSGTSLPLTRTTNGETTTYHYDYANRLTTTTVKANANTDLASTTEYDQLGRRRSTTDAYGRTTYYLYDQNDRVTRTVRGLVPNALTNVPAIVANSTQTATPGSYTLTDKDGNTLTTTGTHSVTYTDPRDLFLKNLSRDLSPNAKFLITDTIYDAEGQTLISTDARGIKTWHEYDSLGRNTLTINAVGTPDEIRSEQIYDDNSNLVESHSPRHFTEGATLTGVGIDTFTYNGRNLRASHTTAAGSTIQATESWTYYLDGRADQHTDFRGNADKSYWHTCCGRHQATTQRDGKSTTIYNTDFKGNSTHTATISHANLDPTSYPFHNPIDAETLQETTTRYDGRGRPTFTTRWLTPLGMVDDDARISLGDSAGIPIAGLDGIPASDGLTTSYTYDEDLTDGVGIDATYATQLNALTARYGYNPFTTGANGYAVAVTNPAGETTVRISDGAGRTILTINPEGDISTTAYDEIATLNNAPLTIPGALVVTTSTDANGNSNSSYTDAAGRTIARADALGNKSYAAYNANGSVVSSRDPNGLGTDCTFDSLNHSIPSTAKPTAQTSRKRHKETPAPPATTPHPKSSHPPMQTTKPPPWFTMPVVA